jgi:8-oxo-dGTP pyrophosphatase MutT (NUDIX family)
MSKKNKQGAGILVFRDFDDGKKVLILLDRHGRFDIPKGHIDAQDPNHFSTAQRECFEETQVFVTMSDLLTDSVYQDKKLTIFCAETLQDPVLIKNPESGELEHIRFYWLHPDIALVALPSYLSDALRWGLKHAV